MSSRKRRLIIITDPNVPLTGAEASRNPPGGDVSDWDGQSWPELTEGQVAVAADWESSDDEKSQRDTQNDQRIRSLAEKLSAP